MLTTDPSMNAIAEPRIVAARIQRRRRVSVTASCYAVSRSTWTALGLCYTSDMTIKRLDHVSVVVDDLATAIAFFTALGMTVEGETAVEGPWVDRVNGLERVQVDIVMMRTPDGHGRLELTKFRNPKLVAIEPTTA